MSAERPLAISFKAPLLACRTLLFHLTRGHFALGLESFCHQLVFYVHYAENLEAAQNILKVCLYCLQVRGGGALCPAFPHRFPPLVYSSSYLFLTAKDILGLFFWPRSWSGDEAGDLFSVFAGQPS